ncbi:MAG TPA: oxidoreductase [Sphingomonas sp.]|nr:oxidoreductase [Sphingomonas sp.]
MAVNVALIGYGLAGAVFHAPLIAAEPRLRLTRVVSSRAADVARAFPDAIVSADPEGAFTDDAVQLVVIATPNKTHATLARAALLAGKHVVVDKPFVLDARDGADLIYLARDRGQMLSVFHNRRWDGDFLTVHNLVRSGRLGEIVLAEMRWDRFRPKIKEGWREVPGEGTGLLADLGPHLVDQSIRLFGYPDAIAGDIGCQRTDAFVDDYFEIGLHYGPRRVILSASSLVASPRPRFALHGSDGSFVKYGLDPQEQALRAGGGPHQPGYGEDDPAAYGLLTDAEGSRPIPTQPGDWRIFYERVAEAILHGRPPPVDPADALAGLSIIEFARRSAREGRLLRFTPPG